jgi:hypothetical protein
MLTWLRTLDMVRTLGGCVAVAICSAIHREHLNNHLSSFLQPTQIEGLLKSSGYIATLPEGTRNRIGVSFGDSYNKQFQIMLAFAGLNIVIAILLAVIRKKLGIFGAMPQRKDANEFTRTVDKKTDDAEAAEKQADTDSTAVDRASIPHQDSEGISAAQPK